MTSELALRLTRKVNQSKGGSQMATVHGIVGIRLKDNLGIVTSHSLFVSLADTTTMAAIVTAVQTYCGLLDPITDAMGVDAHFTLIFPSTGLKTAVAVDNPLGNGGLFSFSLVSNPYKFSVLVPAFAEAKISGSKINLTDSAVSTWFNWLRTNGTPLQVESKSRIALDAFLSSELVTRKHRKSETKVSYEIP